MSHMNRRHRFRFQAVAFAALFLGAVLLTGEVWPAPGSASLRAGAPSLHPHLPASGVGGATFAAPAGRALLSDNTTCALTGGELTLVGAISGQECCADRDASCCAGLDNWYGVIFYFAVVLYTFLGLAIICDDYFCESLEAISEALSLSDDVAGATFMAAGSSAPELFTAVVTTLIIEGSEGLGTIVGSAIFNIMIIVGVTAICAGQALQIWWYPLTRDCVVYVISIIAMAAVVVDDKVEWFESLVLVICYGGYIALMVYNERITDWIESRTAKVEPSAVVSTRSFSKLSSDKPVTDKDVSAAAAALAAAAAKGGGLLSANPFAGHHGHHQSIRMKPAGDAPVAPLSSFTKKEGDNEESGAQKSSGAIGVLSRPMSRHNQLTPLQRPDSKEDVTAGDVESGHAASPAPPGTPEPSPSPTKSATASLLGALSGAAAAKKKPASASTQSKSTPPSKKKRGPNPMFRAVNRRSANPDVEAKRRKARAQLQVGTLMKVHSAKSILLRRLRARQAARGVTPGGGSKTAAAASAFGGSGLLGKLAAKAEEKKPEPEEEEAESLQDKIVGVASIPYVYLFKISVPDCREKKWEKWYMVTFSMSIFWIGVLSFLMVDFAARAGCVMKVPGIVMGLVVIAAGTSVPDALSSILVAKNGQGDMAVANVLGSNVFNIFLGLGLPWFLKSLVSDMDPIILPSDENIIIPVIILLGYVVIFVAVIAGNKWRLTKQLGYVFIVAHAFFVVWSLLTMLDNPVISI